MRPGAHSIPSRVCSAVWDQEHRVFHLVCALELRSVPTAGCWNDLGRGRLMAEGGEVHIRRFVSHCELIVEFSWGSKFSHCRNY